MKINRVGNNSPFPARKSGFLMRPSIYIYSWPKVSAIFPPPDVIDPGEHRPNDQIVCVANTFQNRDRQEA
jgi:hypothetical protein